MRLAKNTQHDTSKVPRKMTMDTSEVLRLPHKTALQNTSECQEVPHLPRETKQRNVWNLQKWPLLQSLP